jgi:hypothetical protein
MRAAIIATAAVAGLALCGSARAEEAQIRGIGASSCALWLSNAINERDGEMWITGFWSGLNLYSNTNRRVGQTVDAAGLIGEVRKVCGERPSTSLGDAALDVYAMIAAQHR